MTELPSPIAVARLAFIDARLNLADAIREACPAGNSHAYVQHRDRQSAWCEACGFAEDGTRIKTAEQIAARLAEVDG